MWRISIIIYEKSSDTGLTLQQNNNNKKKLRKRKQLQILNNRKNTTFFSLQFSSVQSLSRVQLFVIPWTTAHQASLSITNSGSSLKLTSIESVMLYSHLILCHPLFFLPPIPPSIRVFSNESNLRMRWPKY